MKENIIEETKKFNKKNYKENDLEAKKIFKSWFEKKYTISKIYKLIDCDFNEKDKKNYDAKIQEISTGREILVELEIRSKNNFNNIIEKKYPTIHIPYRKIKNNNISGTYIIMGRGIENKIIITKFENIRKAFSEGRYENREGYVDGEEREDTFVNLNHDEVSEIIVDDDKKYIGPSLGSFKEIEADIFDLNVQYIAHQCNCITSHSAGFAKKVFDKFPESNIYKNRNCNSDWKNLPKEQEPNQIIVKGKVINMLSQVFPGKPKYDNGIDSRSMRLFYFKNCLEKIGQIKGIKSVAFPYGIGCSMGGGKWEDYREAIIKFSKENKIDVIVAKNS